MAGKVQKAVGRALPHDSAHLHVCGSAAYTDDLPEPRNLLHVAIGMSERVHAKIRKTDLSGVISADGVVDVCVATDIPGDNNCGPIVADETIFAPELVEYVGQAMFAVAADTVEQARRAVRLAKIDYEELEPILDPVTAVERQSFVLPTETLKRGEPANALVDAPHRLQLASYPTEPGDDLNRSLLVQLGMNQQGLVQ